MSTANIRLALLALNFVIWGFVVYALGHPPHPKYDPLGAVQGKYSQLDCHNQPGTHPQYVNVDGHPYFLACGVADHQAADSQPLPTEMPATMTAIERCVPGQPNTKVVMFVVITYPSGLVLRFDAAHLHGLSNAGELIEYANSALDPRVYQFQCDGVDT
jgi:hypothetical protein